MRSNYNALHPSLEFYAIITDLFLDKSFAYFEKLELSN